MNKIRFGIIGFGVQGSSYAGFLAGCPKAFGPQIEGPEHGSLGAICDIDRSQWLFEVVIAQRNLNALYITTSS